MELLAYFVERTSKGSLEVARTSGFECSSQSSWKLLTDGLKQKMIFGVLALSVVIGQNFITGVFDPYLKYLSSSIRNIFPKTKPEIRAQIFLENDNKIPDKIPDDLRDFVKGLGLELVEDKYLARNPAKKYYDNNQEKIRKRQGDIDRFKTLKLQERNYDQLFSSIDAPMVVGINDQKRLSTADRLNKLALRLVEFVEPHVKPINKDQIKIKFIKSTKSDFEKVWNPLWLFPTGNNSKDSLKLLSRDYFKIISDTTITLKIMYHDSRPDSLAIWNQRFSPGNKFRVKIQIEDIEIESEVEVN